MNSQLQVCLRVFAKVKLREIVDQRRDYKPFERDYAQGKEIANRSRKRLQSIEQQIQIEQEICIFRVMT